MSIDSIDDVVELSACDRLARAARAALDAYVGSGVEVGDAATERRAARINELADALTTYEALREQR